MTDSPHSRKLVDEAMELAKEALLRAQRVLLTSHRRPDGDGTGSMVGLAHLLRAAGKSVTVYSPDLPPRRLGWLTHKVSWAHQVPGDAAFDVTVVVDCADVELLGGSLPAPTVTGTVITLDHHASARPFGDIVVWDPSAAAVGVLITRLANLFHWSIDAPAATALYVSIISDTGGFRHANANAECFEVAAQLVAAGATPVKIAQALEEKPAAAKLRLLGSALATLELHAAGRVALLTVTTEMVERAKGTWDDIEGIVNWARNVDGSVVGVLLTTAKGGGTRMSMRSRSDKVDVGRICMRLGGGGHPGAGGGHLALELEAAKAQVVAVITEELSSPPNPGLPSR